MRKLYQGRTGTNVPARSRDAEVAAGRGRGRWGERAPSGRRSEPAASESCPVPPPRERHERTERSRFLAVPNDGLDAEKLQILARWAGGLRADQRDELAAAGRAIELLIEEIERLHVLLWGRRLYPEPARTLETVWSQAPPEDVPDADGEGPAVEPEPEAPVADDVGATLRRRLLRRFHSESPSHS